MFPFRYALIIPSFWKVKRGESEERRIFSDFSKNNRKNPQILILQRFGRRQKVENSLIFREFYSFGSSFRTGIFNAFARSGNRSMEGDFRAPSQPSRVGIGTPDCSDSLGMDSPAANRSERKCSAKRPRNVVMSISFLGCRMPAMYLLFGRCQ